MKDTFRLVLEALRKNNLYAKMKKCCFGQSEVDFLGHRVTRDSVQTDDRKIQAIREWPLPTSIEHLQSFLGLANYYRRFIKSYAEISTPLSAMTCKDTPFRWTSLSTQAFAQLKLALVSALTLALPNPK